MNRAILVTFRGRDKLFSSLKKVCETYKLNYHTVGKSLRDKNEWDNKSVYLKRLPVE